VRERIGTAATVVRGLMAGVAGTLAMDLVWFRRYRRGGGDEGFADWELATSTTGFEGAAPPAQVGARLSELVLRRPIPDRLAALTTDVVHWSTGLQWAAAYALAAGRRGGARPLDGPALGLVAWGASYALLPALGVYRPIWEYEPVVLWRDLSAHLVFGTTCAVALWLLGPRTAIRGRTA
jgi:hypothetical protein